MDIDSKDCAISIIIETLQQTLDEVRINSAKIGSSFKLCTLVYKITLETIRNLPRFLNHSDASALNIIEERVEVCRVLI